MYPDRFIGSFLVNWTHPSHPGEWEDVYLNVSHTNLGGLLGFTKKIRPKMPQRSILMRFFGRQKVHGLGGPQCRD